MVRIRKKDDELAPVDYWTPEGFLRDMERMFRELRTSFEDMLYPFQGFEPLYGSQGSGTRVPAVDMRDTGKEIIITAEMPGIKKEDVDIQIGEDSVTIKAESKMEEEEKGDRYYRKERRYSSFYRELPLTEEVLGDQAKATLKNGVLELILPKKTPAQKKEKYTVKVE